MNKLVHYLTEAGYKVEVYEGFIICRKNQIYLDVMHSRTRYRDYTLFINHSGQTQMAIRCSQAAIIEHLMAHGI